MKNKSLITGIIAAATPIPCFIFSILFAWIFFFGLCMGVLGYDTVPMWLEMCSLLPLLISPIFTVFAIIHSLVKIKQKLSWLSLLLSVTGFAQNLGLVLLMIHIGRF